MRSILPKSAIHPWRTPKLVPFQNRPNLKGLNPKGPNLGDRSVLPNNQLQDFSPNRPSALRWISLTQYLCRFVIAGVFIAAAVPKLMDPNEFAQVLAGYRLPYYSIHAIAAWLPPLELFAGVAVLIGYKIRAGLFLMAVMTLGFLAAIYSVILRGVNIECGCFGATELASTVGWPLFWRDVALFTGICVVAYLYPKARKTGK